MKRIITATSLGNIIEWYEYGVYSYMAAIIGAQFFPESNKMTALLSGFAIFAISFIVRPLGGIIFGSIGDRFGRKQIMLITILLMSFSGAALGLLPNYNSIGLMAPILLIILRIGQGLAAGGEYAGATVYVNESADKSRRGFFASFLEAGTVIGYLIGSLVVALLTFLLGQDDMSAWGWRIPFLLSLPLALAGLYIRVKLEDSPAFTQMKNENSLSKEPLREVFSTSKKPLIVSFLILAYAYCGYYTVMTFIPSYFSSQVGLSTSDSFKATTIGMILMIILIVTFGALSDRIGKRLLLFLSSLFGVLSSFPIFIYMNSGSQLAPLVSYVILTIIVACVAGVYCSTIPMMFQSQVRIVSYAISLNIAAAIFGGELLSL
ncbi:MFS transporter [Bacillus sp. T3]|uniref:MFS transporter n=1 Tax=Bacillus sp. T3 TaxID=467262 RepID=UPI002981C7B0|nr:MFS transporter [Bacillus sp. T3]